MFVMVVLVVSALLQLCAAYLALRLIPITRYRTVWAAVAVAISLMALRRGITAYALVTGTPFHPLDLVVELVALASSALMLIGMAAIKPLFQSMKNSEEVARQSEKHYRDLYEAAPCGFLSIDREGSIRQCNRRAEQILGYARGALFGIPMAGLLLDSHCENGQPPVAHDHLWDGVPLTDVEVQMCTADARAISVSLSVQPIADEKDSTVGFRAIIVDITERVKATEDLRLTQFVVDHAGESIFLMDRDGRFTFVNDAVCDHLGYSREEILRMSVFDIDPVFSREAWQRCWEELKAGKSLLVESVHCTKDGRVFPIEISANLVVLGGQEFDCAFVRDISDRKKVTEQLQRQLNELQSIYNLSDAVTRADALESVYDEAISGLSRTLGADRAAILLIDPDGVMRFRAWKGLSDGYRRAVEGHSPWSPDATDPQPILIPDVDSEPGQSALKQVVIAEGIHALALIPLVCDRRLQGKLMLYYDQPHVFTEEETRLARTIAGHIAIAIGRMRAEDALRESERRFRELLENIALIAVTLDTEGRVTFCNDCLMKVTGWSREELIGADWFDRGLPADVGDRVRQMFRETIHGGTVPTHYENEIQSRDARRRLICWTNTILRDPQGNVTGTASIGEDITERKQAEEQIMILKHSLDAHRDGVYWMDTDNKFVYVNDAGCKALGYEPQDLIGKSILDVNPGASREAMNQVWEILRANGFFLGEAVHCRRDGSEFPVDIMTTYVKHDGKEYAAGFARDITDRKRTEEQLLKAKRLEAAGQLAGQIAHDFNNLLGPLIAYPELIAKHLDGDPRMREMLHDMEEAAKQIAEINQELLTMSRRGHYNLEPVDLNHLIEHSLRTLPLPAMVTVHRDLSDRLRLVRGGPSQVVRILANLMTNAVDAMPEGGTLTVRTGPMHLEEPLKRYPDVKPGDFVRLDVADTGRGIPAAVAGHIFEPFFTTKKADKKRGSGLGLTVVHSVMEDHGGYVEFESTPGVGTTFSLFFPVTVGNVAASGPLADVPKGNGESVLVADDDSLQLRIAERTLRQLGYTVHTVSSGEEAIAYLANHPQDVVLLDMVMDGIDGTETLRRIKKKNPDQIAIILSGFACSDRVDEALRLGAKGFVQKPVKLAKLAAVLHDALSGKRSAAPLPVA